MGANEHQVPIRPTQKSMVPQKVDAWAMLVVFWVVFTLALAIVLWTMTAVFGSLDFWLCMILNAISSF